MADMTSLLDRNFKADHLRDSDPIVLTIAKVEAVEIGQDKELKPVAYFNEDPRGLVLNATKYATLTEANKSRDTDDWPGTKVELSFDPTVKFGGKAVGGVALAVVKKAPKVKK